jgi:hypothetical protein
LNQEIDICDFTLPQLERQPNVLQQQGRRQRGSKEGGSKEEQQLVREFQAPRLIEVFN